jgi:hypothetical protein
MMPLIKIIKNIIAKIKECKESISINKMSQLCLYLSQEIKIIYRKVMKIKIKTMDSKDLKRYN